MGVSCGQLDKGQEAQWNGDKNRISAPVFSVTKGAERPVDVRLARTEAERRPRSRHRRWRSLGFGGARRPVDVCFARTVAERRLSPTSITEDFPETGNPL